jgi:NAD(P)-dependent dehydrogenase (short-subunit alcohol dehydrogenase family)
MAGGFESKVALVTGGASSIGRATALAFVREGATGVIADLNGPGGEATVHMTTTTGGDACAFATDVTRSAEVDALITRIVATPGRLDRAINNAGIGGGGGAGGRRLE